MARLVALNSASCTGLPSTLMLVAIHLSAGHRVVVAGIGDEVGRVAKCSNLIHERSRALNGGTGSCQVQCVAVQLRQVGDHRVAQHVGGACIIGRDQGRCAGHRHRLFNRARLQLEVLRKVIAGAELEAGAGHRAKSLCAVL